MSLDALSRSTTSAGLIELIRSAVGIVSDSIRNIDIAQIEVLLNSAIFHVDRYDFVQICII